MCTTLTDFPSACRLLAPFWIISVPDRTVFERAIELAAVIGSKRQALVQAPREVRVADEIPSIQQAIVGLCCVPCVLIVEATSREEWCVGEDRTESRQIDGMQAPGIEELLLFSGAVDLLVSLIGAVRSTCSIMKIVVETATDLPARQSSHKTDQGATLSTSDKVSAMSPVAAQL